MKFRIHYWPPLTGAWIALTFITSYTISVLTKTVYPLFPYISDTGSTAPASCVFGQMLNMGAIFTAITLYLRYHQVNFAINSGETNLSKTWNNVAFWLGNIVAIGISFVANFQGNMNGNVFVLTMHLTGAIMAFGIGLIYMTIQTRISFGIRSVYYEYPQYGIGQNLLYFRVFLTVLFYISFLGIFVFAGIGASRFTGDDQKWWTKEDGGYGFHLGSTISEWVLGIVFMTYMATLKNDFKSLKYDKNSIKSKCQLGSTEFHETMRNR